MSATPSSATRGPRTPGRLPSGAGYSWPTSFPYRAARGVFFAADDIGAFAVDLQFSADANVLHDSETPDADSGFWYLVRPDCVGASWTSGGGYEVAGRDSVLP